MQQINQFSHQIDKERNILKRQIINNFSDRREQLQTSFRLQVFHDLDRKSPPISCDKQYYSRKNDIKNLRQFFCRSLQTW
jgi:hypothetical protein